MVRRAGACLGLFAFCITIVRGLAVGNTPESILVKALWAMAVFFALGLVLGSLAQVIVQEHIVRRTREAAAEYEREAAAEPAESDEPDEPDEPIVVGVPATEEHTEPAAAA